MARTALSLRGASAGPVQDFEMSPDVQVKSFSSLELFFLFAGRKSEFTLAFAKLDRHGKGWKKRHHAMIQQ